MKNLQGFKELQIEDTRNVADGVQNATLLNVTGASGSGGGADSNGWYRDLPSDMNFGQTGGRGWENVNGMDVHWVNSSCGRYQARQYFNPGDTGPSWHNVTTR